MRNLYLLFLIFTTSILTLSGKENPKVKFGIISDIHPDVMHDGTQRLKAFLDYAAKEKVDFIISLGDFCQPKQENREFMDMWLNFSKPQYSTLGNHDSDGATKEKFLEFAQMPNRYYTFTKGAICFVVLDMNNTVNGKRNSVDPQQIEWLKATLINSKYPCILFSHQGIPTCGNANELTSLFAHVNSQAGYNKVVAAFFGHEHGNYMKKIEDINYVQINSASYIWIGEPSTKEYVCMERYSDELNAKHPHLKNIIPYEDSVFGIVTINKKGIKVKGIKSNYVQPNKGDMSKLENLYGFPLAPAISDFKIPFINPTKAR